MNFKVIIALTVICSQKGTHGTPLHSDISDETYEKLDKTIAETQEACANSSAEVDIVKHDIESRIDTAAKSINEQIDSLKEDVKRAKKEAETNGINIDDCVLPARKAIHEITKHKNVTKCGKLGEIRKAEEEADHISDYVFDLFDAPWLCAVKGGDEDACVLETIADVQGKVKQLQTEVTEILKSIDTTAVDECVAKEVLNLKTIADEAVKNWNECLATHKTTTTNADTTITDTTNVDTTTEST